MLIRRPSAWPRYARTTLVTATCLLALSACSSNDDDDNGNLPPDDSATGVPVEAEGDVDGVDGDGNGDGEGDGNVVTQGDGDGVTDGAVDGDGDGVDNGEVEGEIDGATDGDGDVAVDDEESRRFAFVSGATPITFDAGQIERLTLGDEIVSSGMTEATGSDIQVATDGSDVYQIGRFQIDSLTRFDIDELRDPIWQYSVNGDETAANPYAVVFASDTKAYVVRYGSPKVWVIDPSAATEADFKTGEIDLSAYDADGVPEAAGAVIVDGKLFVLMQRLVDFAPVQNGYVAVIDTVTDTEIDTGMGEDGLMGIALGTSNPDGISYLEDTGEIHVVGRGNLFGNPTVTTDPYNGGIEVIDPDTFTADLLVDDGTMDDNQGFIADALTVSSSKGYVLYYTDFGVATLRSFDPMTGIVTEEAVAGLIDRDISVLAEGPQGRIWIGLNDPNMPGFTLLDPSDDSIAVERIAVEFNPNGIVFVDAPAIASE